MHLSKISIDSFGMISELQIDDLNPGLNVIYGSNGSGKTTLLEMVRGLFHNFDRARNLRLLPPLKKGVPGGSVSISESNSSYELIRRAVRTGHLDTLAIRADRTDALETDETTEIRRRLKQMDSERSNAMFFVSGPESLAIGELARIAMLDGIELGDETHRSSWISEQIDDLKIQRDDLFGPQMDQSKVEALEAQRNRLAEQIESALNEQREQDLTRHSKLSALHRRHQELRTQSDWLLSELQGTQTDLGEVNDRLWRPHSTESRQEPVLQEVVRPVVAELSEQIQSIDDEIAQTQHALCGLAKSRYRLSVSIADLAGADFQSTQQHIERQRSGISQVETEIQEINNLLDTTGSSAIANSGTRKPAVSDSLSSAENQLGQLGQELDSLQSIEEHSQALSRRKEIDQCERRLIRHLRSLKAERERFAGGRTATTPSRDSVRTLETSGNRKKTSIVSASKSAEQAKQSSLVRQKQFLQQEWWKAIEKLCDCRTQIQQFQSQRSQPNSERVQNLRREFGSIEQQLADAREQWQSLSVFQTVLKKSQQEVVVPVESPVMIEASELLDQVTLGRYTSIRFTRESEEFFVSGEDDAELSVNALSRGTLEQVTLCFRLALWKEYQRRGIALPFIFDEILTDSDETRVQAAIALLIDFAAQSGQLIFLTCQHRLAEMFQEQGIDVRVFPGSSPLVSQDVSVSLLSASGDLAEDDSPVHIRRIQPDQPYWLQPRDPAAGLPSLGEQMARRLGALGVRSIGDLIELDAENTEMPLESLQISASTLRAWQSEARLLCCVPHLTGKDAQLLVALGINSPSELAQGDAADLFGKSQRLREEQREYSPLVWLSDRPNWPLAKHFESWIYAGMSARTYRQARDQSQRVFRTDAPHLPSPSPMFRQTLEIPAERQESNSARLIANENRRKQNRALRNASARNLSKRDPSARFFLNLTSPVADAPGIGTKTARRLKRIGITTVSDLLSRAANEISVALSPRRFPLETVQRWKQQATLACRIPEIRGRDAELLVACGLTEVEQIAHITPQTLLEQISTFASSESGQKLLSSRKQPSLANLSHWINLARQSRDLRAA